LLLRRHPYVTDRFIRVHRTLYVRQATGFVKGQPFVLKVVNAQVVVNSAGRQDADLVGISSALRFKSFLRPSGGKEREKYAPGAPEGFFGRLIAPSARLQGAGSRGWEPPDFGAPIFGGNSPVIWPPSAGGRTDIGGPWRRAFTGFLAGL